MGKDVPVATEVVPRVTSTDPQVRAVGLAEERARERGSVGEVWLRLPAPYGL